MITMTEEQQRFWGRNNWKNLRYFNEEVMILGVYLNIDNNNNTDYDIIVVLKTFDDTKILYKFVNIDGIDIYTYKDGTTLETIIFTEIK